MSMKFKKIVIRDFKKFDYFSKEFSNGINIIVGENESGKTTLIEAIHVALFTSANTNSKVFISKIKSWKNTSQLPIIELTFEHDGSEYILERDFNERKESLKFGPIKLTTGSKIQEKIKSMLGIENINLFISLSRIDGGEIATIDNKDALRLRLSTITSGTDTDTSMVLKNIKSHIADLSRGLKNASTNPGSIKQIELEIKAVQDNIEKYKIDHDSYIELNASLNKKSEEIKHLKSEVETLTNILKANDDYTEGTEKIDPIRSKIEALVNSKNTLKSKMDEIQMYKFKVSEFNPGIDELRKIKLKLIELNNKLNNTQKLLTEEQKNILSTTETHKNKTKERDNNNVKALFQNIVAVSIILVSSILILILNLIGHYSQIVGISGIIIAVCYGLLASLKFHSGKSERDKENDDFQKNNSSNDILDRLNDTQIEIDELLDKAKCESTADVVEHIAEHEKLFIRMNEANEYINSISTSLEVPENTEPIAYIDSKLKELYSEQDRVETTKIKPNINKQLDTLELQRMEDKLYEAEDKLEILEQEYNNEIGRLSTYDNTPDKLTTEEEHLQNLNVKYNKYLLDLKAAQICEQAIISAIKQTSITAGIMLKLMLEEYLPKLTSGKYSNVQVSDDYNILVFEKTLNTYISVSDTLSKGTTELIYLFAKIAYLNLLTNDKFPPIFLDDVLVFLDLTRESLAYRILESIAQKNQIILFKAKQDLPQGISFDIL